MGRKQGKASGEGRGIFSGGQKAFVTVAAERTVPGRDCRPVLSNAGRESEVFQAAELEGRQNPLRVCVFCKLSTRVCMGSFTRGESLGC